MIKILLVDDDEISRGILKDFLQKNEYEIIEAGDGEKAIEIFDEEKDAIHLVLLDVMMPKLDGWSVLRHIKKESKTPVVMITAREDDEDELFGFELGVDEYITKPYNVKIISARIESLLKKLSSEKPDKWSKGGLEVDFNGRTVSMDGRRIALSFRE